MICVGKRWTRLDLRNILLMSICVYVSHVLKMKLKSRTTDLNLFALRINHLNDEILIQRIK